MKVRTVEELSDRLASDLAWRKKELTLMLSEARKSTSKSAKREAMIRSAITILYAHWEGFIKLAATSYLNHIALRRLRYNELQDSLCALAATSKLQPAITSGSFTGMMAVADFFLNRQNESSNLPVDSAIRTRSNLNSKVLKEIVAILAIDYSPYKTKEKLIDKGLLDNRNNIAHGKELYPSIDILENLYKEIIGLMNIFRNQVENAAINHDYRKDVAA